MSDLVPDRRAWVVTVDMGYGHQRAAFPFRDIAHERIITANGDKVVEPGERRLWRRFQYWYEFLSRLSGVPWVGGFLWRAYDRLQRISPIYPFRDLSKPTLGSLFLHRMIKRNFARSLPEYARTKDIPFVATFFVPALAADHAGLKNVFCVVTDADINRIWVAEKPRRSNIVYLAPTEQSRRRLFQYGVPADNLYFTGFPLPQENVDAARADLAARLGRLDPRRAFYRHFRETVDREVGPPPESRGPIEVTYAVGGAGAQKDVAARIVRSLKPFILDGRFRLNLVAGTRFEVRNYFMELIRSLELEGQLDRGIRVLFCMDKPDYFARFNALLRGTDVLWTKPSELVFYTALGLPILMTPPLGSHEEFNRDWVLKMGAGFMQEDPALAAEWLWEWRETGILGEAAFHGFLKAPRHGTENIKRIIFAEDRSRVELLA
ncbi:MAG TPA: hypothetical protein PLU30_04320 [Verrucomicrobiae bacterium]|nr:hypothetical protein [Verrucomicrobiae bacterium]